MSKVKCSKCGISEFDVRWYSGPECRSCKAEAAMLGFDGVRSVSAEVVKSMVGWQPTANVGLYSHGNMWVPYQAEPTRIKDRNAPGGYCPKGLERMLPARREEFGSVSVDAETLEASSIYNSQCAGLQLDVSGGEFIPRLGKSFKTEEPGEGWAQGANTYWAYRDSSRQVWQGMNLNWYSCKDESCLVREASSCAEACKTALEGYEDKPGEGWAKSDLEPRMWDYLSTDISVWRGRYKKWYYNREGEITGNEADSCAEACRLALGSLKEPEAKTQAKLAHDLKAGDTYRTAKHHQWFTVSLLEGLENMLGPFWRVHHTSGNYQLLEPNQGVEVKL